MIPINVALCAYGLSGKIFHQPFIKYHPQFRLHGVLERTKSESLIDNPDIVIYRSPDELLADREVDLVVVNTPNYLHYEYAGRALRAGKHVIVEKPFTATAAEANELLRLAAEQSRFISVYHNRRYDSDFLTIRSVVQSGVLGTISDVEFRFERYKPAVGPKAFKEESYAASGFLYDLGSHLVDAAVALFGKPESVFADCRKVRLGSAVDDAFEIVLIYDDMKRVRLISGQVVRQPLPAFSLHGNAGTIIMERTDQQEALLMQGVQPTSPNWAMRSKQQALLVVETASGPESKPIDAVAGNYMGYYDAVYESIAHGKPFPISSEEIVDVIAVLEAAKMSSDIGRVVEL